MPKQLPHLGLTWTCHYPEERAADHPGPVRCIAVKGLEGLERGEGSKKNI